MAKPPPDSPFGLLILDISSEGGKISHSAVMNKAWVVVTVEGAVLQWVFISPMVVVCKLDCLRNSWRAYENTDFLGYSKSFWLNRSAVGLKIGISNSFQGMLMLFFPNILRVTFLWDTHGLPGLFPRVTRCGDKHCKPDPPTALRTCLCPWIQLVPRSGLGFSSLYVSHLPWDLVLLVLIRCFFSLEALVVNIPKKFY